jgi:hypothetical protein
MDERGLFREILKHFGYLPVTTDRYFGEHIHWAKELLMGNES